MTRLDVPGGAVSTVVAVALTVSGCAVGQEAMVDDPDLTKQAAIEQTLEHLERTEASLPEGMALSWTFGSPDADGNSVQNSGSLPCSSSDGATRTDPQMVYVGYFVTGVPEGENTRYLMQIRQLWESWGWTPTGEPDEQSATYVNEEGYVLDVVDAGGSGGLSVEGQTPCIAGENFQGSEEVPRRIGGEGS